MLFTVASMIVVHLIYMVAISLSRVIEQSFQREQYSNLIDTCRVLISHLQKLNISSSTTTSSHALPMGGASADLEDDGSPSASATNLEPPSPVPGRSESAPTPIPAASSSSSSSAAGADGEKTQERTQEGYILRREEEVLVPRRVTLTRKRSKKEKKRLPVS